MSEEEGEKWGLVPTHAYAVLDIREYKVSSETEDAFRCIFEICLRWETTDFFVSIGLCSLFCLEFHWEIPENFMML